MTLLELVPVDEVPEVEGQTLTDVFGANGAPSREIDVAPGPPSSEDGDDSDSEAEDGYEPFYRTLLPDQYDLQGGDRWWLLSAFRDYEKAARVVSPGVRTMYATIKYPVKRPAHFRLTFDRDITYGMMLYGYSKAYQKMYELEEEVADSEDTRQDLPSRLAQLVGENSMLNRPQTYGRYGIWGHSIGDLVYNGRSTVVVGQQALLANFGCDS